MREKTAKNLLNLVRRNYQEIASEFSISRQKLVWPEIEKIVSKIKDGDSVLDIGCGNGRLLELLKDKNINYLGIDNSSKLIEIASQNYPNYEFQVGDILDLSKIVKNEFDYVFCIAVLAHIPSQKLRIWALNELGKKAKDQGSIIISVWNLWQQIFKKKKYKKIVIKSIFEKIFTKNDLDFGDLIFPWKGQTIKSKSNQDKKIFKERKKIIKQEAKQYFSQRYYHLFSKNGLQNLIKKTNLSLVKIKKDPSNYWLFLKKE